jgi:predicted metal-dependent peptidase
MLLYRGEIGLAKTINIGSTGCVIPYHPNLPAFIRNQLNPGAMTVVNANDTPIPVDARNFEQLDRKIRRSKIYLYLKQPFFGILLFQTLTVPNSDVIHLHATPKVIFYNPQYFNKLTEKEVVGALLHGILHLVLDHITRGADRDHQLWDLATDYAIADMILNQGFSLPPDHPKNPQFSGWSAEEIYNYLRQKNPENPPPSFDSLPEIRPQMNQTGEENEGDSQQNENSALSNQEDRSENGEEDVEGDSENQEQSDSDGKNRDSNEDFEDDCDSADEFESEAKNQDSDKENDETSKNDYINPIQPPNQQKLDQIPSNETNEIPPPIPESVTKQELEDFHNQVQVAISSPLTQGFVPAELTRVIPHLEKSQLPWQTLLAKYMLASCRSDYRWIPPNYKYLSLDLILPTNRVQTINIAVGIDTSGSITQPMLRKFVSEVKGIVQHFNQYTIKVISCDACIHNVYDYSNVHPIDDEEIMNLGGGGGTDFRPVFEYMNKQTEKPDVLIYITDAEGTFPPKAPKYPVIWLVTSNVPVPWGTAVRWENWQC